MNMPPPETQVFKYLSLWVTFLIQAAELSKEDAVWSDQGHAACYVDVMSMLRDGGILDMSVVSGMVFG